MQILLACCGIIHPLDLMVLAILLQRNSHTESSTTLTDWQLVIFLLVFFGITQMVVLVVNLGHKLAVR